ncbi:SMC5-SMC6 complex localization factor protein 2 isoform X2 [Brachyistius frenatus]|uniref:SMC5-SMC6 complex localization factor protein 2 isoform X2 n=1 Tax=Brachyistius frenatus TaxID=100188 RepID=UPI0037E95EFF
MKPSQVPNRLSHSPSRRVLPIQRPELSHGNRPGPHQHTPQPLGPIRLSEFFPSSPANIDSSVNLPHPTPKDTLGPLTNSAQARPGLFCSSRLVDSTQTDNSSKRPHPSTPSASLPASPQFMKSSSNHSPSSYIRGDQLTESNVISSNSGSKNVAAQRQESNKIQQNERRPSSEKFFPVDLNGSPHKRHRDFEHCHENAKKLRFQGANSGKTQTTKPTVGNSPSTSLVSQLSFKQSPVVELSPKTTDFHLRTYPAAGQSSWPETTSTFKPNQSSGISLSPKHCARRPLSMGVKQAYINAFHNQTVTLREIRSSSKPGGDGGKKRNEENNKRDKSSTLLSSEAHQKDSNSSHNAEFSSHRSAHTACSPSVLPGKTPSRKLDSSTSKPTSEPNSGSLSCRTGEQNKTSGARKHFVNYADIDGLFTPDPITHVVAPHNPTAKPKINGETIKSSTSEKGCLSSAASSSCTPVTHPPDSSQSRPLERQASEGGGQRVNEEDPPDVELDLGLSFALDWDESQSFNSSEDEELISLQEIMRPVAKPPPDTPEKGAFSEPSTPGQHSCRTKTPLPSNTKTGIYKNNLDQMLKEIQTSKKAKETENQLLTACEEDLLRITEYEEMVENQEQGISSEHQEFLQRYSLMSNAIREVPPGEVVFNLEKFGQLFDQDTLQFKHCTVNPRGTAQKTLLWSSRAQLRLHVIVGLFQETFDCSSPCPPQVSCFLFKMMSVHCERIVSEKILQALCDIACTAAYQIVEKGSQEFKVWVPTIADVMLVLMNMGAAFVTLFPFENLQPPFTEGDLLKDINMKSGSPSTNKEQITFPEHNCNSILKYLSFCMNLCPRAYSDDELLLLLVMVGRVSLDSQLILQSSVELYVLQYRLVDSIRSWDTMLPRICKALTDLTDDHHNMCLLVHLLPDNKHGTQLRRHLSLSMISKLLDGSNTYTPTQEEFQLSDLRPYLPRMRPSALLRGLLNSSGTSRKDKDEDMATLDQQSFDLCYSLLKLTNEASKYQLLPAHQKEQMLCLLNELQTYVKSDIRENEKCLYRYKVKDLVARIYNKWLILIQKTAPLNGRLYDFWQPVDSLTSSSETREAEESTKMEPVMEEDEEEEANSTTEENEIVPISEEEEEEKEDNTLEEEHET